MTPRDPKGAVMQYVRLF